MISRRRSGQLDRTSIRAVSTVCRGNRVVLAALQGHPTRLAALETHGAGYAKRPLRLANQRSNDATGAALDPPHPDGTSVDRSCRCADDRVRSRGHSAQRGTRTGARSRLRRAESSLRGGRARRGQLQTLSRTLRPACAPRAFLRRPPAGVYGARRAWGRWARKLPPLPRGLPVTDITTRPPSAVPTTLGRLEDAIPVQRALTLPEKI